MPRLTAGLSLLLLLSVALVLPGAPWEGAMTRFVIAQLEGKAQRPQMLTAEEAAIFYVDDEYWFGEDPPESLQVRLHDLIGPDDDQPARAMIEHGDTRQHYAVGETLQDTEIVLSKILPDGVLLKRHGSFSLLWAESTGTMQFAVDNQPWFTPRSGAAEGKTPTLVDLRGSEAATRTARHYRERLYRNPMSLVGTIDVEVIPRGPGERGYRLYPGRDKDAFRLFQLNDKDEIIGINGINLNAPQGFTDIYRQLSDADHLTVTLLRKGEPVVVLLSLDKDLSRTANLADKR